MKDLPDNSVDMVLCDLPYGTTACKWDVIIPFEPLWENYKRVIKPNGAIVLFGSEPFASHLRLSNLKMYKYDWVWIKNRGSNFANTAREPMKEHETVSIFGNGVISYFKQMQNRTGGGVGLIGSVQKNKGGKTDNYGKFSGKDIIISEMRVPSSWQKFNCEVGYHPTQKPVTLLEYLIKTYTLEGETVLDNCMGSGSTGVACKNLNRKFIGIEKDKTYFNIAAKRISEHSTKD